MTNSHEKLLVELRTLTGTDWVKTDPADLESYGKDWTKVFPPKPLAIVLPNSIDQLVDIVKLANHHELAIVPSGGRTGLSGGAVASNGELVVAFDRMNKILDFDPTDRQAICQPGVVTEQLQQFAQDNDLFYPVDFASSGSSQIGGNVATNAGGIKVIRYGTTRNWVQGLKVVTGNGDLLELNSGLVKNATGYDLRHLFIGSEGTLGLIAEVTVNLCNKPFDPTVLILGIEEISATMNVLQAFQNKLKLTAFEFFSDKALTYVIEEKELQRPFGSECEFYALIEFEKISENDMDTAMGLFESCMESGWIVDGAVGKNLAQAESLWRLRENISEAISKFTPYKNDISVKVSKVPQFLQEVDELVTRAYPDFEIIWFGHIGDGNVHLNILKPDALAKEDFFEKCSEVSNWVFEIVRKHGGSISAEHGVGLLKKPYLHYSRSPAEIDYLKAMKAVFDPKNIMNPGKLFD
jgi:glycolate oxidase subunit GlcD